MTRLPTYKTPEEERAYLIGKIDDIALELHYQVRYPWDNGQVAVSRLRTDLLLDRIEDLMLFETREQAKLND